MQYYSDKIEKLFKTQEELENAEKQYDIVQQKKQDLKLQRKEDANTVEVAWKDYENAQSLANEAYNKYKTELKSFIEKHGSYHTTVTSPSTLFDIFLDYFSF